MKTLSLEWLMQRGYTLSSAARTLNVSHTHLSLVLSGKRDSKTLKDALLALPPRKLILRERAGKTPQTSKNDMKQGKIEEKDLASIYKEALQSLCLTLGCALSSAEAAKDMLGAGEYKSFFLNLNGLPDFVRDELDRKLEVEAALQRAKTPTQNKNHD